MPFCKTGLWIPISNHFPLEIIDSNGITSVSFEKSKHWRYYLEGILLNIRRENICYHFYHSFTFFMSTLTCGVSKGFMKALKAFIKPFEAP